MKNNHIFIGAYDEEKCVRLAILRHSMFKYIYLYGLKVNKNFRQRGIAHLLLDSSSDFAKKNNYRGIYTRAQDNNLIACRFYLNYGFYIGGFDNNVYRGTSKENKSDVIFIKILIKKF